MSVQTDLEARTTKLQAILSGSNDAITDKGGTAAQNLAGLPEAIGTMQGGNLMEGNVTPTGQEINLTPDDGYDGFSAVTVAGDDNLAPQNIADGITIYGVAGTLKVGASGTLPSEYDQYVEHAKLLYTGDYANYAVSENDGYISVIFMTDAFQVVGYKADTTQFSAQGWVLCRYEKNGQNWDVIDHRDTANEYGFNYVKNIRFCTTTWTYNGTTIWPMSSGGGGGTGGDSQAEILDLVVPPKAGMTYTVPAAGVLFFIGRNSIPAGFNMQIQKRMNLVCGDASYSAYKYSVVGKRVVSVGEIITMNPANPYAVLILAKPGTEISECVYRVSIQPQGAESDTTKFGVLPGFCGFAFYNRVYGSSVTTRAVKNGDRVGLISLPDSLVDTSWCFPGYLTGAPMEPVFDTSTTGFGNVYSLLCVKLSAGTPVHDIDDSPIINTRGRFNFTAGKGSFAATLNGYVIFVGAYRDPETFPLDGFTTLKQYIVDESANEDGAVQHLVIAYKVVASGDTFSWNTTKRFGGTFYQTAEDVSNLKTTIGTATRENGNLSYPAPGEGETMLGLAGFVYNDSSVGETTAEGLYIDKDGDSAKRLTTFLADENTTPSTGNKILFPFIDGEVTKAGVQGIWVKFKK